MWERSEQSSHRDDWAAVLSGPVSVVLDFAFQTRIAPSPAAHRNYEFLCGEEPELIVLNVKSFIISID